MLRGQTTALAGDWWATMAARRGKGDNDGASHDDGGDDDVPDLVQMSDISYMLSLTRQRANELALRRDFPEPVASINRGRTRLWRRADIRKWARGSGRTVK
jgi:hypothetical protein